MNRSHSTPMRSNSQAPGPAECVIVFQIPKAHMTGLFSNIGIRHPGPAPPESASETSW